MTTAEVESQVALPEYRPESFRSLWRRLGENDAGLEWIEVAIRELLRQQHDGGAVATNNLASAHGVRVNDLDGKSLMSQWAKLQIGAVASYLEVFLDDFRVELPREGRQRNSKEDLVTYMLDVYKVKKSEVGELQFDLLNYYRRVRNRFIHDPTAEESKRLVREAESLRETIAGGDSPYRKLSAPNAPEFLGFDDFVLFSRALKDFAKGLCSEVQVSDEEIKSRLLENRALRSALRKQNKPERRANLLANYIRKHFGFHLTAGLISQRLLDDGLLAQW